MDEESLEAAIEAYSAQLQQVEAALGAGLDPAQQADLAKLRDDLKQLIELTESSLLSVRKSRLLTDFGEGSSTPHADRAGQGSDDCDDEYAAFQAAIHELSSGADQSPRGESESPCGLENRERSSNEEEEECAEEEEDVIGGMKVRAPYYTPWGTLEYHNAMVVEAAECSEDAQPRVRVLYIHPTHKSMKLCPFFLDGKCRFKENCRFSHGEVVRVAELHQFQEPDLSSLQVGSTCLARHEDGIWYTAKITDLDDGYYTVKFDSLLLKEAVVEGDGIIPPMRSEEATSSSGSEEEEDGDSAYAKVIDPGSSATGDWTPACSSSFAGWEAHTRGIGSKLMAKMGYEFGKGLGKNAEGRVEPVQTVVLPKGKSLDQCAEILRKKREGKLDADKPRKRHRKGKGGSSGGRKSSIQRKPRQTVFDFLNEKLGVKGKDDLDSSSPAPAAERNSKGSYHGNKSTKRTLNVRLFQTAEKIEQTQRDIGRIREALTRNVGRDRAMTSHLEERLSSAQLLLAQLKSQEASIQQEKKKADTHKKMTEF
ncbi:zinc finger CCCH-type with G patch domain-containing protein [Latimeria chalumnae]|uniref:Zinc finger CCCH-type with G patch domain-containing protein n=1 Tax=Latimeria chalumnae TaxID=7897 RepID=H3A004_LATCH|nr:PREDICTED: zinc finger CCCH-type with G patch domain-containing protein [Latimeria chalumnae]|eukprot:XP_006013216.1 PREDICTED: zinc finger CCCH-type with G patch domain-containing protein [Latimeria chalumnae]